MLALLSPLASPARLLMVRDVAFFHLPLRQAESTLVLAGELPEWNAGIHGGQPILSNPNYAAFYPPTWLALLVPVGYSLSLLVILHAAWAVAGAWRLLRQLGAGPEAATLGAMGFAASSWFLSLTSTFTVYCCMAWFPWVVAAAERAFAIPRGERWSGAVFLAAACLAMQFLAGEPVTVLVSGLAVAGLALGRWARMRRTLPRLAAIALLAAALGAVQLVPTAHRLAGSARSGGLPAAEAGRWSSPPLRFVDFVLPRFWGDSSQDEAGLWFGWGMHDRDFPYVVALYSGLLLTLLALAALLRWPIPYRGAWAFAVVVGLMLALGRHGPFWEPLRRFVPLLGVVRFPERFIMLTAAAVPIAGALGWQHLAGSNDDDGESRDRRRHAFLPAAFAAIVAAVAGTFVTVLAAVPAAGEHFIREHSGAPPSPRVLAAGLAFLRREALVSLLLALAVAALLLLLALSRVQRRALAASALLLLAVDLWWYGRDLEPTLPTAEILAPPPAVAEARRAGGRLFSPPLTRHREVGVRQGPPGFQQLWSRLQRLDPYTGTLWGIEYALDRDYDLMLTPWARHADAQLLAARRQHGDVDRLLAAWDVGAWVRRRELREMVAELHRTRKPPRPFAIVPLPARLPRYRFVRSLDFAGDKEAATRALDSLDLATSDVCIGDAAAPPGNYSAATLLAREEGQRVRLRYRAPGRAFLVAAVTYDDGWEATLDNGSVASTCPTALGQLGVALPAGERTVTLRYRDPWVRVGAAGTAITLLGAALAASRRRPTVESAA